MVAWTAQVAQAQLRLAAAVSQQLALVLALQRLALHVTETRTVTVVWSCKCSKARKPAQHICNIVFPSRVNPFQVKPGHVF